MLILVRDGHAVEIPQAAEALGLEAIESHIAQVMLGALPRTLADLAAFYEDRLRRSLQAREAARAEAVAAGLDEAAAEEHALYAQQQVAAEPYSTTPLAPAAPAVPETAPVPPAAAVDVPATAEAAPADAYPDALEG